jgi:hypothetical protein
MEDVRAIIRSKSRKIYNKREELMIISWCLNMYPRVGRLLEEQYLVYFMGGLKTELRLRVRTFNPRTSIQAMKLARDVKNELLGSLAPKVDLVGPE